MIPHITSSSSDSITKVSQCITNVSPMYQHGLAKSHCYLSPSQLYHEYQICRDLLHHLHLHRNTLRRSANVSPMYHQCISTDWQSRIVTYHLAKTALKRSTGSSNWNPLSRPSCGGPPYYGNYIYCSYSGIASTLVSLLFA